MGNVKHRQYILDLYRTGVSVGFITRAHLVIAENLQLLVCFYKALLIRILLRGCFSLRISACLPAATWMYI